MHFTTCETNEENVLVSLPGKVRPWLPAEQLQPRQPGLASGEIAFLASQLAQAPRHWHRGLLQAANLGELPNPQHLHS